MAFKYCAEKSEASCEVWCTLQGRLPEAVAVSSDAIANIEADAVRQKNRINGMVLSKTQLTELFIRGLCAETGFTKVVLEHLETAKMIKLTNGQFRRLGGIDAETQSDIAEALTLVQRKMRSWADLVRSVLDAGSRLRTVGCLQCLLVG